jgi:hypothetical protein
MPTKNSIEFRKLGSCFSVFFIAAMGKEKDGIAAVREYSLLGKIDG